MNDTKASLPVRPIERVHDVEAEPWDIRFYSVEETNRYMDHLERRLAEVEAERDELSEIMESFVAYLQDRINETGRNANPFFKDVEVDESLRDLGSWRDAIYAIQDETRRTYSPAPTEAP